MHAVLLDADTLNPDELDMSGLYNLPLQWSVFGATAPAEVAARIADASVILTNKVVLNAETLKAHAPHCRYIGVLATGMNNIDVEYCKHTNIKVANIEGYGTDAVAQHCLMLLLNLATSFSQYSDDVRQGKWEKSPHFCLLGHPVMEVAGKHLVIVGYGELGKRFAALAKALGMKVSVAARPGEPDDPRPSLDSLLPEADVVSLHCVLSEQTFHLMNAQRFSKMKRGAFIINTARGDLIDETALLAALRSGQLGGAGLDVLSTEPPDANHPLLHSGLANLIVTPHSAWLAKEARQRLVNIAVDHLQRFLSDL
ncbi:D-2-hydroxyacid dehydrogenase [Alteromonas pelagimontana]|uniref:D-2-hydroxyacid dehydrogenase n=1 Tax=Alteromonas pelagimontana TaxID=1858656 RepID=A0A6M4ME97_9ALTE|nr:D-2-hydroxyacid dehydrogenase [Alteromonas pelagimontana]QJR80895.1 D-2-hydroxyacid dehydrogenase [Alteromonas pelagimontana]